MKQSSKRILGSIIVCAVVVLCWYGVFLYSQTNNHSTLDKNEVSMVSCSMLWDAETESYPVVSDVCTANPCITDIGRPLYPIAEEFNSLGGGLGEVLTALSCDDTSRVMAQFFVNEDAMFTAGSYIELAARYPESLKDVLIEIGYECSNDTCTRWKLSKPVSVDLLSRIVPYVEYIRLNDCVNCG